MRALCRDPKLSFRTGAEAFTLNTLPMFHPWIVLILLPREVPHAKGA